MSDTSARVDLVTPNNVTWEDAFIFGTAGDTSWSFTGQNFRLDVKGDRDDAVPLLTLSTANGEIVVDDVVQRILHLQVPDATLRAALVPGCYVYDLIMYDNSTPAVRVALLHGHLRITQGVTGD